jgi:hypothetical protein
MSVRRFALAGALVASAGFWPAYGATQASGLIPKFAGADFGWRAAGTDFIKPKTGPGPISDPPGHEHGRNNVPGVQPSFRIADLSNPILQPWTREALRKTNADVESGHGGFTPQVSCIPLGVPAFLLYPAQPVYFIQTAKEVVMVWPPDHQVRHVYLDVPHSKSPKPSWYGESVGHYENSDTLVIDTIGLNTKTYVDNFRTPHSDKLHIIERFTIAPDQKTMDVDVTVDDPGAFTVPWHAEQHFRRQAQGPMQEESCAESTGNFLHYDMDPIPHADRPDF